MQLYGHNSDYSRAMSVGRGGVAIVQWNNSNKPEVPARNCEAHKMVAFLLNAGDLVFILRGQNYCRPNLGEL